MTDRPPAGLAALLLLGVAVGAAHVAATSAAWAQEAPAPQASPDPAEAPKTAEDDLLGEVVPGDEPGRFPTSRYEVPYDAGLFDVMEKLQGWLTNVVFGLARWLVRVGIWVITWAYTFAFGNELAGRAGEMAHVYQRRLVGPLGLADAALLAAVTYAGWQALRGRLHRGAGELLVSLAVAAAGTVLLRDPAGVLHSGMDMVGRLSGEVLAVTAGDSGDSPGGEEERYRGLLQPLGASIHRAYVEDPWELMTFGELLDGTPCARARDAALALGPASPAGPWDLMGQTPGCERQAEFSRESTFERLAVAVLVLFAALVVMAMLALVAGTVVVAQLVGVALVAVMPLAAVGGILPGSGRQLLWRWGTALLRALLAILVMSFFLSFLLFSLRALLEATAGRGLLERFGILLLLTVVMFVGRKRFLRAGQAVARNLGGRAERARVGGSGQGWLAPASASGVSGVSFAQLAEEGRRDARQLTGPGKRATRAVLGPAPRGARPQPAARGPASKPGGSAPAGGSHPDGPRGRGGARGAASARMRRHLDRAVHTRPVRAAAMAARAAGTAGRAAINSTINLPVAAPRAAAAARQATSAKTAALRERLARSAGRARDWGREWQQGARHPVRAYRDGLAGPRPEGDRAPSGGRR